MMRASGLNSTVGLCKNCGGEKARRGDASAPPGSCRLEDLLGSEREEEHHADVVHDEVQRMRDALIATGVDVCPDDGGGGPGKQQQRIVEAETSKAGSRRVH